MSAVHIHDERPADATLDDALPTDGAPGDAGLADGAPGVARPADGISVERWRDGSLVTLWGEIDGSMRAEASASMVEAVGFGGPLVVDTSGVTFIDSSGLGFVLQLYRLAQESGHPCALRNPSPVVSEMLQMLGLAGHLPLEDPAATA